MANPQAGATGADTEVPSAVEYGADVPDETELRLCGDVRGKRVLVLGCGDGRNAVAFARQGAHAIALDPSGAALAAGRRLAAAAEARVEWHEGDPAALAFLRADSIDLAFAAGLLPTIEDVDRLFRQVHRVLRPGAAFVFSYDHPLQLVLAREQDGPGVLPLGRREVRRSYFEPGPVEITLGAVTVRVWPRTVAAVFGALHRAGLRVDALLEPEPVRSPDPGPAVPTTIVWRARKEGM
ncbi:MAG: hypothetical protein KatS3mg009_0466 [Acidimicrobiia bacterium]|nr:MAG: hypothetical protein KatS3mg009_0466 [Acidimicrobiia bacterium]